MKFAVIGLGSMGRRRIRLLKQISDSFEIVGVDSKPERCAKAEKELGIPTADSFDGVLAKESPDAVVICTSPLSHASLIREALLASCHVFTELNLVDDLYEANISLAKEKQKVLFLSSPFLYREEVRYLQAQIHQAGGQLNYYHHVGQYLPDWHPWESINDFFVGDKRTGGCRELFAVELPWLIRLFGEVESFEVLSGKNTGLAIPYNDNYLLLLKHSNGNKGLLAVDVVSRKAVRILEVFGEDLYVSWDGTPNGLLKYDTVSKEESCVRLYSQEKIDQQAGYASFVVENAFRNELEAFIAQINGTGAAEYTFEDDRKILSLINEIEAREKK